MDIFDVASQSEILGYGDSLDESIAELKTAGSYLGAAFRDTKLTNDSWANKKPLSCRITYLLAAPKDQPPAKFAVARKVSGGLGEHQHLWGGLNESLPVVRLHNVLRPTRMQTP